MWTKSIDQKKIPNFQNYYINNLINKTFGTHKQTHKHMAGKRWQGGKDGAMIKKAKIWTRGRFYSHSYSSDHLCSVLD